MPARHAGPLPRLNKAVTECACCAVFRGSTDVQALGHVQGVAAKVPPTGRVAVAPWRGQAQLEPAAPSYCMQHPLPGVCMLRLRRHHAACRGSNCCTNQSDAFGLMQVVGSFSRVRC